VYYKRTSKFHQSEKAELEAFMQRKLTQKLIFCIVYIHVAILRKAIMFYSSTLPSRLKLWLTFITSFDA
jgi:isochorismate hydrolase